MLHETRPFAPRVAGAATFLEKPLHTYRSAGRWTEREFLTRLTFLVDSDTPMSSFAHKPPAVGAGWGERITRRVMNTVLCWALREDFLHHMTVDIREAEVATGVVEGEFFVIQA